MSLTFISSIKENLRQCWMDGSMLKERNSKDEISLRWVKCNIPQKGLKISYLYYAFYNGNSHQWGTCNIPKKIKLVSHLIPIGVRSDILVRMGCA